MKKILLEKKSKKILTVDIAQCSGCRLCERNCPTGAIKVTGGKARINYDMCNNCFRCVYVCPNNAIKEKIKKREKISVSGKEELKELSIELNNIQKKLSNIVSGLNRIEGRRR